MADELIPWINSAGEGGVRNSMQEFPGAGTNGPFEFNFAGDGNGYIDQSHIKAYRYDPVTALTYTQTLTFVGPNQVTTSDVIPTGQFVIVYRDTPKDKPLVNYSEGAVMDEPNLDKSNEQSVYIAAEMLDRFDAINATSSDAINRSVQALNTANTALSQSQSALDAAAAATSTANSANAASAAATNTANAASATANDAHNIATGIDAKAQQALDNSNTAVTTANGVDAKATTALSNSNNAVQTANSASTNASNALSLATSVSSKADSAVATANTAAAQAANAYQKTGGDINGPVVQTTQDGGGMFFRHINGNYGAGFRNDGSNWYVLSTNAGDTRGQWSGFRPFSFNMSTGAVNIDGSGSGTTFGGSITVGSAHYQTDGNITGGAVWGGAALSTWLANNKLSKTNDTYTGRLTIAYNGAAEIALQNSGGSYAFIRGYAGAGGFELVNSAYSAGVFRVENTGDIWTAGAMRTGGGATYGTDGNIYMPWAGNWLNNILGGKASAGARVQWDSALHEFGYVNDGSGMTAIVDNPWVMVGLRTDAADLIYIQGVVLRNA